MKYVHVVCSPSTVDKFTVLKVTDVHAIDGSIYVMSETMPLEDYAAEWKAKVRELERRYKYLERGRNWAVSNFRNILK